MQNNITIYDLEEEVDNMETTAGLFCAAVLLKDAGSMQKDMIINLLLSILKTDIKFCKYDMDNYSVESNFMNYKIG